jgi:hypothetical protein
MLASFSGLLTIVSRLTAENVALLQRLAECDGAFFRAGQDVRAARQALADLMAETTARIRALEEENRKLRERLEQRMRS